MSMIPFLCLFGSSGSSPACPTSMQVSEVISLTYRQVPQVFVPANLVQQDGTGRKWLRLRPSSPAMAKLVLGHMVEFRHLKNPSLAASPQLKVIQDKIKAAVMDFEQNTGANMFGEPDPVSETSSKLKDKKRALENAPESVNVQLGSLQVEFKKPSSWKETDILVPLCAEALTRVCDFIVQDVAACFEDKKRSYVKSGPFAQRAKTEGNDANDE